MSPHEQERLSAYLDQALPPEERAAVEAHLAACAECRERLAGLSAVDAAARELELRAPEGYFETFAARVRGRIEAEPARRGRSWRLPVWSWAVAAALLLAVVAPLTLREHVTGRTSLPAAAPAQGKAVEKAAPAERHPVETARPAPAVAAPVAPSRPRQQARSERERAPLPKGGAAVAEGVTAGETAAVTVPPPATPASEPEAKEEAYAQAGATAAADQTAPLAARPALAPGAAPAEFQRRAATGAGGLAAEEAFRRLERIHPDDVAGWRAQRERWRAFALSYPAAPQADEARVRAIAAGLELVRLGAGAADEAEFRREAQGYLSRQDAAQKPRVRELLEAAGPSR